MAINTVSIPTKHIVRNLTDEELVKIFTFSVSDAELTDPEYALKVLVERFQKCSEDAATIEDLEEQLEEANRLKEKSEALLASAVELTKQLMDILEGEG